MSVPFQGVYPSILVFDVETTGLNPETNDIIEFGYVLYEFGEEKYEIKKEENFLVKTKEPLPEKIVEITGITDLMLARDGIDRLEFRKKLSKIMGNLPLLMAYNAQFDISFVIWELREYYNNPDYIIKAPVIDVLAITRDRKSYPHRLFQCLEHWKVENVENTHRASDDAKATYALFKVLMAEHYNAIAYVNRMGWYKSIQGVRLPQVIYIPQGLNGGNTVYNHYKNELKKKGVV